ncbi:sugar O-acetyltransferase [Corynebacterium diphtheriae]|nr:sugar O-acetyltransferase [Corynebacterium diphtheriae]CAB0533405.1 sugar O-acetyltransferase [Corynebacterium diphtheriae]
MSLDPHTPATMADQRAQRWHIPVSPEITQAIARTAELVFDYNATHPTHTEELDRLRRLILSPASKDCTIRQPLTIEYGVNTTIGKDTFINYGVTILDTAEVTIGSQVLIGPNCQLITVTHPVDNADMRTAGWEIAHPIVVGKQAWLGAGVIVLPGVTIGERAVIGAGSVVTHDIPDDTIAYGNPARVIRTTNPHTTYEL